MFRLPPVVQHLLIDKKWMLSVWWVIQSIHNMSYRRINLHC